MKLCTKNPQITSIQISWKECLLISQSREIHSKGHQKKNLSIGVLNAIKKMEHPGQIEASERLREKFNSSIWSLGEIKVTIMWGSFLRMNRSQEEIFWSRFQSWKNIQNPKKSAYPIDTLNSRAEFSWKTETAQQIGWPKRLAFRKNMKINYQSWKEKSTKREDSSGKWAQSKD